MFLLLRFRRKATSESENTADCHTCMLWSRCYYDLIAGLENLSVKRNEIQYSLTFMSKWVTVFKKRYSFSSVLKQIIWLNTQEEVHIAQVTRLNYFWLWFQLFVSSGLIISSIKITVFFCCPISRLSVFLTVWALVNGGRRFSRNISLTRWPGLSLMSHVGLTLPVVTCSQLQAQETKFHLFVF